MLPSIPASLSLDVPYNKEYKDKLKAWKIPQTARNAAVIMNVVA